MMILSIIFYIGVVALACYLGDKYAKHLQKKITQRTNSGLLLTLVRRFMPTMIAHDLVGVQPMDKPAGQIFSFRYNYGEPEQLEFDFTPRDEDAELALKYNVQSDPDGGIIAALKRVTKDLPTN